MCQYTKQLKATAHFPEVDTLKGIYHITKCICDWQSLEFVDFYHNSTVNTTKISACEASSGNSLSTSASLLLEDRGRNAPRHLLKEDGFERQLLHQIRQSTTEMVCLF